jgi:glutamate synthase (NADPH/NADH) small chain
MPKPPLHENKALSWPHWPMKLRTSSSHEEGAEREFSVVTTELVGENGRVTALRCARSEMVRGDDGAKAVRLVPGSDFEMPADLVLLAMGFTGPRRDEALLQSQVEFGANGAVKASTSDYQTSAPSVFACGDMRRGQSLVVWAIREGRECAAAVDSYLSGHIRVGGAERRETA